MMGIALGGLGVLTLRLPYDVGIRHVDLPTFLFAAFPVLILAIIAYFANPSETSFRAFLTELAFRQHISRLNATQDCDPEDDNDARVAHTIDYKGPRKKPSAHCASQSNDSPVMVHFANKASVSLRTPDYSFRSFAILTFAIVHPTELSFASAPPSRSSTPDSASKGAWFVGAFGHWWLVLEMRMAPRHVRVMAHDNDPASSPATAVVPAPDTPSVPRQSDDHHQKPSRLRAPPRTKAALRERLSLNTTGPSPPRPTTPPPLPKSASLPLHGPPPAPPLLSSPATAPSPTPTPALAELFAQLDAARANIADLHTQLAAPLPSHAALHAAVTKARETKKHDDANRAAVKARTKALDDERRHADAGKREAEKRLKTAETERDGTTRRIERLQRDIDGMRMRITGDAAQMEASARETAEERTRLESEVEARRAEMNTAEEAIGVLTTRARDLEGVVAAEEARLEALKARHMPLPPRDKDVPAAAKMGGTRVWPPPLLPFVSPRLPPVIAADQPPSSSFSPFSKEVVPAPSITSPSPMSPSGLLPSSLVQSMESPREVFFGPQQRAQHPHPVHAIDLPFQPRDDTLRWISHPHPQHLHAQVASANKGLNPTAKAFTLTPRGVVAPPPPPGRQTSLGDAPSTPSPSFFSGSSNESNNTSGQQFGDGGGVGAGAATTFTQASAGPPAPGFFAALHSAFAPSPAEREALQRSSPLPPSRAAFFNPWPAKE